MLKDETLNFKSYNDSNDLDVVPYFNNDGDSIQDILEEVKEQTKELLGDISSQDDKNIINIDFCKNNTNKK